MMNRLSFVMYAALWTSSLIFPAAYDNRELVHWIKTFTFSKDFQRNIERLKELENATADRDLLNTGDKNGRTLLHRATRAGDTASIVLLSSWGIDMNPHDKLGKTPLHFAGQGGYGIYMKLLECGADPDGIDHNGYTPYEYVGCDCPKIKSLLKQGMKSTLEQFYMQEPTLKKRCIYTMLTQKIDIARLQPDLQKEIKATQEWLDAKLHSHLLDNKPESPDRIALLLRRGANPNSKSYGRCNTPLFRIAGYLFLNLLSEEKLTGVLAVVSLLLEAGARPHEMCGATEGSSSISRSSSDLPAFTSPLLYCARFGAKAYREGSNDERVAYRSFVAMLCAYAQDSDYHVPDGDGKTIIQLLRNSSSWKSVWRKVGAPV